MINHLEPIDIAMRKAIEDGMQTEIYRFVELPEMLDDITRSHRVSAAIRVHKAYLKQKGGEKTI